jgi:hypothetical protein
MDNMGNPFSRTALIFKGKIADHQIKQAKKYRLIGIDSGRKYV